jgi:hypothetical protein
MIRDIHETGQGNGQCPFEVEKSRGAATQKRHRGTKEPENTPLQEDTAHNTPVQEPGNPHGHDQGTETTSVAQQIATLNTGSDREDLTTDVIDIGATQ